MYKYTTNESVQDFYFKYSTKIPMEFQFYIFYLFLHPTIYKVREIFREFRNSKNTLRNIQRENMKKSNNFAGICVFHLYFTLKNMYVFVKIIYITAANAILP